jgi:hypothetical protein
MSKTEATKSEQRGEKRLLTHTPVTVRDAATRAESPAHARDVSTSGIFLYTQSRMVEGSDVELVLILPPELMGGKKSWVCCHARVVRVEPGAGNDFGVAAEIRRMEVLPELGV